MELIISFYICDKRTWYKSKLKYWVQQGHGWGRSNSDAFCGPVHLLSWDELPSLPTLLAQRCTAAQNQITLAPDLFSGGQPRYYRLDVSRTVRARNMCQQFGRVRLSAVRELWPASSCPTLRLSCAMHWRTFGSCLLRIAGCTPPQNFRCTVGLLLWREEAYWPDWEIQREAARICYLYDHRHHYSRLSRASYLPELLPFGKKLTFLAAFYEHFLILAWAH